ncbi:MAG: hypothetical protein HYV07_21820 [Deltaproteobacteria bacterium]|nr:hypothetical protein [Deltaproteobacteria bacterium]
MLRRAIPALVLAGIAACTPRQFVNAQVEPGTLLVVASVGPSNNLERPELLITSADGRASVERGQGDVVVAFAVPPGSFLDEAGREVAFETLSVAARSTAAAAPGCGRCLAASATAPQMVFPGDFCSVPRFAPAFFQEGMEAPSEDVLALYRRSIGLVFPGACACTFEKIDSASGPPLRLELIQPPGESFFPRALTQLDDGTIMTFGESGAISADPEAHTLTRNPDARVDAPVRLARTLPDGRVFIAASGSAEDLGQGRFFTSDRSMSLTRLRTDEDGLTPVDAVLLPGGRPRLLLAGVFDDLVESNRVSACDVGEDTMSCAKLTPPSFLAGRGELLRIFDLPEELLLVLSARGIAIGDARAAGPWSEQDIAAFAGLSDFRVESADLAWTGNRVVLCLSNGTDARTFVADLGRDSLGRSPSSLFRTIAHRRQARCRGVLSAADGSWVLQTGPNAAVSLDRDGQLHPLRTSSAGIDREDVDFLASFVPGWDVVLTLSGGVWVRRSGTNPLQWVLGSEVALPFVSHGVRTHSGTVLLGPGVAVTLEADSTSSTEPIATTLEGTVTAGIESSRGTLVVATWDASTERAAIIEYSLDSREILGEVALPGALAGSRFLLELREGLFVTHIGRRLVQVDLANLVVSSIAVAWDDPFTAEVEEAPREGSWHVAASSRGIFWVGGAETLVRVEAFRDGLRAERRAVLPPDILDVNALRAFCPDHLIAGSKGQTSELARATGAVWELHPDASSSRDDGLMGSVFPKHVPPKPLFKVRSVVTPDEFLGKKGNLLVASGEELRLLGSQTAIRPAGLRVLSAVTDESTGESIAVLEHRWVLRVTEH